MASIQGWGRETWNSGAWSQQAPVSVTGIGLTSSAGTETVTTDQQAADIFTKAFPERTKWEGACRLIGVLERADVLVGSTSGRVARCFTAHPA